MQRAYAVDYGVPEGEFRDDSGHSAAWSVTMPINLNAWKPDAEHEQQRAIGYLYPTTYCEPGVLIRCGICLAPRRRGTVSVLSPLNTPSGGVQEFLLRGFRRPAWTQ